MVYLTIEGETLVTTADHPFYTVAGEWVEAGDLRLGDDIRMASWATGNVESVYIVTQPQPMYNFTVATAHTYFVGEHQWLVHNCRALANTANGALRQLPQNLRGITVAAGLTEDGIPTLAVFGRTTEITDNAVAFLRNRGWNVLDSPSSRTPDFHAERQLFGAGFTNIGISRQAGMCASCEAFFVDKSWVTITAFQP